MVTDGFSASKRGLGGGGYKEVGHREIPLGSKASPEESTEWKQECLRNKSERPVSHQISNLYLNGQQKR